MNSSEFDKLIDEQKKEHPIWCELSEPEERVSASRLKEIEILKRVVFPDQFKHFIEKYGAGDFAFTHVYSPEPDSGWNLWREIESYDLPEDFLPISDNGGGDYLGFKIKENKCGIQLYWADHENGYEANELAFDDFFAFIFEFGLKE